MSMTLQQASELAQQLKQEIGKAVIGQKQVVHETLIALIAGGNVLIEGVPGLGKNTLGTCLGSYFLRPI